MKNVIRNTLLIAGASLAFAGTASASEIKIEYAPVELTTSYGRDNVYRQVEDAAKRICGATTVSKAGSLATARRNETCVEQTVTDTLAKIGDQRLSMIDV